MEMGNEDTGYSLSFDVQTTLDLNLGALTTIKQPLVTRALVPQNQSRGSPVWRWVGRPGTEKNKIL